MNVVPPVARARISVRLAPQADGGSVPFAGALQRGPRPPEVLLFGVQDALSGLHGPDERVLLDELARGVRAEAELLGRLSPTRADTRNRTKGIAGG